MRNTIRAADITPVQPGTVRATNANPKPSPLTRAIGSIFCPLMPHAINVEASRASAPSFPHPQEAPPVNTLKLSADELAICERLGISPQDFAKAKTETAGDAAAAVRAEQAANAERHRFGGLTAAERDICERTGVQPGAFMKAKHSTLA
ncbi:hypothetical protein [Thauera sp.]